MKILPVSELWHPVGPLDTSASVSQIITLLGITGRFTPLAWRQSVSHCKNQVGFKRRVDEVGFNWDAIGWPDWVLCWETKQKGDFSFIGRF